jgi:hypothetical protein
LLVFSTILVTATPPVTEIKSVGKGEAVSAWGPHLRALATTAGAGAAFTIGELRIIGS